MRSLTPATNHPRDASVRRGVEDVLAMGFRWRNRMVVVFLLVLAGALVAAFLYRDYESQMKILVTRDRLDPVVTPEASAVATRPDITLEELTAEVELLRNDDVLRAVVLEIGLQQAAREPIWYSLSGERVASTEEVKVARAVSGLQSALKITRPNGSNMITVSYSSADPERAADVLTSLSKHYMQKHMDLRRPSGQFDFFEQQAEEYRKRLTEIEDQIAQFSRTGGTVVGQMEVDLTVQRVADLRYELQQTKAEINETQARIATLQSQIASTPERIVTEVRKSDNPQLRMELKTKELELELRRTQLLETFQPDYPLVQQVEKELEKAREAIAAQEESPLTDETSQVDPTREWMRSELAKASAAVVSLQAKADTISQSLNESVSEAQRLSHATIQREDLVRAAQAVEESFQLYVRKREEARISNALDQSKILNVVLAQQPTVPVLPARSPLTIVFAGIVLAALMSLLAVLLSELLDNSFRTPAEVDLALDIPVLATLPPLPTVEDGRNKLLKT